jgi:hypothetical protein
MLRLCAWGLIMPRRRLIERTDGRRKGYQEHRSTVESRLDPRIRAKLEAMRGGPHQDSK